MSFQGDSIFWVEVEKVVPNPFQPRREFDEEKLRELGESIRMYGVLQPLTVTRKEVHTDDGAFYTQYELIAGERRLRASKLAGVEQVPVLIRSGEDTEQEKLELAIIENLQREDLNAVDRALAFKQLAEVFDLSHTQVAKKVGRSREYVSNSIRLLALPETMLNALKHGDLSEGHARTLLMLKDKPEEQEVVFREILLKKLSVREVERIARKIATDKVRKNKPGDMDAHLIELEKEFTDTLGTRVQILKTDFGGKLTIDYFEEEDLANLLEVVKSQNAKIAALTNAQVAAVSAAAATESVSNTVIQEMDTVTKEIDALSNATALERVETSDVTDESASAADEMPDSLVQATSHVTPEAQPAHVTQNETGFASESSNPATQQPHQSTDAEEVPVQNDERDTLGGVQEVMSDENQVVTEERPVTPESTPNQEVSTDTSPSALHTELAAALQAIEAHPPAKSIEEQISDAAESFVPEAPIDGVSAGESNDEGQSENPTLIEKKNTNETEKFSTDINDADNLDLDPAQETKTSDVDDDLYAMKNFSL